MSAGEDTVHLIEARFRARARKDIIQSIGIGSEQSRYAKKIMDKLESVLEDRQDLRDTPELRRSIADHFITIWEEAIQPKLQLSTGPYLVDVGFKNTAGLVSIDSVAVGKDPEGRPIPGELYMNGYSVLDLIEHTDFVGSMGLMFKLMPLSEEERHDLGLYIASRTSLDDILKQRIGHEMEEITDDSRVNAKLLMHCISGVMHYSFSRSEYINLAPLSAKIPKEGKAREEVLNARARTFYAVADQGLALSARVAASTAYALRSILERQGEELASVPDQFDPDISFGANFLRFLYGEGYETTDGFDEKAEALDNYFQLIRTHGAGNASTFSTRVAGGARADLYAALSSGCNALSGDKHGFANFGVAEQVEPIYQRLKEKGDITDDVIRGEVNKVWKKDASFEGIGHPVYNQDPDGILAGDPRAGVMVQMAKSWNLPKINHKLDFYQRWFKYAIKKLESESAKRHKIPLRNRFPVNVDGYSGLLLQDRIKLPIEANTSMFEVGRLPGHLANYIESLHFGLVRSKTLYVGNKGRIFMENGNQNS